MNLLSTYRDGQFLQRMAAYNWHYHGNRRPASGFTSEYCIFDLMETLSAIDRLLEAANGVHLLSEEEWNGFSMIWQPFSAKRKAMLTVAGDTENYLYFVTEGVQRSFYLGDDGKEGTIVFSYPYSFSGVIDSFLLQKPSKYFLETLTKSEFIRTTFAQVQALADMHHNFESFLRKAVNQTLAGVLERQIELQCFSAEQKFRTLMNRSPHILNLIPHKYIANYIGIDAATFSKLLASVKIGL